MSISSYTELQTAITNWLGGRTDLTTYYPDWIALFEAHAARRLGVRLMEVEATLTVSNGTAALPSDFLSWKQVKSSASGAPGALEYRTRTYLDSAFPTYPSGVPQYFAIEGTALIVYPQNDSALTLIYHGRNSAFANNWLLSNYPDAYLWGSLTEAHSFLADADQLQIAKARRDEILGEVELLDFQEKGNMTMKSVGMTP